MIIFVNLNSDNYKQQLCQFYKVLKYKEIVEFYSVAGEMAP